MSIGHYLQPLEFLPNRQLSRAPLGPGIGQQAVQLSYLGRRNLVDGYLGDGQGQWQILREREEKKVYRYTVTPILDQRATQGLCAMPFLTFAPRASRSNPTGSQQVLG